jgi:hypothetical protein
MSVMVAKKFVPAVRVLWQDRCDLLPLPPTSLLLVLFQVVLVGQGSKPCHVTATSLRVQLVCIVM